MKIKECGKYGKLEYRLPNIPEAMRLLGEMGINSSNLENEMDMQKNELIYMSKLIEQLDQFVLKVEIKIDDKEITEYAELLNHFLMINYLSDIAADIFSALNVQEEKK